MPRCGRIYARRASRYGNDTAGGASVGLFLKSAHPVLHQSPEGDDMTRTITHGQTRGAGQAQKNAVPVAILSFPSLPKDGPLPPEGTPGTLTTQQVPNPRYQSGDRIVYEDGNNNNTLDMTVTSAVGPAKYQVTAG
jgi:hypothetical protein